MLIPVGTDRRQQHTPWVNYILVGLNVLIFLLTARRVGQPFDAVRIFFLIPDAPHLTQFLSYQFLHADLMHLAGNMLFLYVFGNAVEDRLGRLGYLFFYLAGGVLAGLGHVLLEPQPVIGASGAVAAVSGAYLALFPRSQVTLFYWFFFFVGYFEVSSLLLIGAYIALNVYEHVAGAGQVAHLAHLTGYAYGFGIGMGLLWSGLLEREPFDMLALWAQRRRRAQFARMTRGGFEPWAGGAPQSDRAKGEVDQALDRRQREILALRARVSQAVEQHDLPRAAELFDQLQELEPTAVLSQQQQLDLANHFMSTGRYEAAAQAYEMLLGVYGSYPQREQVELILGLIYARYLRRPQRARELLSLAVQRLRDPDQQRLARQVLDEVSG